MAGRIPQSFIDDLLDRVDVVDVVGARLSLRKTGKNYSARCPFHDEKTPSFTVSPDKQFYYCFGCGAGGNAVGFIMDYDRVDFPAAVAQLAHQAGMELPRPDEPSLQDDRRTTLYAIMATAARFYREQLRRPEAAPAVDYLKKRGLSGAIARDFGVGFAPQGWDTLLKLLIAQGHDQALLSDCGLVVTHTGDGRQYDRFRNRIMFPIRDLRGRTLGFGGRVLGDAKPKYLNSPETPLFHKGRELYGLYEARQRLRELPCLLVVEGYLDVVALAQHGIHHAVATLGTAVTTEHLDKLYRHTAEVVFCFDGDRAGRQAARRALDTCLPQMADGRSAKFLLLPEGEDPDTLVRAIGADGFQALVKAATPLSEFLFACVGEGLDLGIPDDRARLATAAAPLLNRLPDGLFRELMLDQLAIRTAIARPALTRLLPAAPLAVKPHHPPAQAAEARGNADRQKPRRPAYPARKIHLLPVERLIGLLVHQPALVAEIGDISALQNLETPAIEMLLALVEMLRQHPDYQLTHILGYWRGVHGQQQGEALARIAAADLFILPEQGPANYRAELLDILAALYRQATLALPPVAQLDMLLARDTINADDGKIANDIWIRFGDSQPELIPKIKQVLARTRNRDRSA